MYVGRVETFIDAPNPAGKYRNKESADNHSIIARDNIDPVKEVQIKYGNASDYYRKGHGDQQRFSS